MIKSKHVEKYQEEFLDFFEDIVSTMIDLIHPKATFNHKAILFHGFFVMFVGTFAKKITKSFE